MGAMNLRRLAVPALSLVAASTILVVAAQQDSTSPSGVFYSNCQLDHQAPDDPIKFPGKPGAAHNHDFFGRPGVDAFTTSTPPDDPTTTCDVPGDTAGYWTPSLIVDGQTLVPMFASARYSSGGKATYQAPPPGLKVIAGPNRTAKMGCKPGGSSTAPFGCKPNAWSTMVVDFPDCWDGVRLDSPDHQAHMAYSKNKACPTSHPVPLVSLRLKVHYAKGLTGEEARLSSGTLASAHADFLNTWQPDRLEDLVERCIRNREAPGQKCARSEQS